MQNVAKEVLQEILENEIIINYDVGCILGVFLSLFFICVISSLINGKKIKQINVIDLLKED